MVLGGATHNANRLEECTNRIENHLAEIAQIQNEKEVDKTFPQLSELSWTKLHYAQVDP